MFATFGVYGLAQSLGPILVKPFVAVFLAVPFGSTVPLTIIAASI